MKYLIILFFVPIMAYSQSNIEWDYLNYPYGGRIFDIEIDTLNSFIYISSYNGISKGTFENNIIKWTQYMEGEYVWDISANGNFILGTTMSLANQENSILKSLDQGLQWERIDPFWEDMNPYKIIIYDSIVYLLLSYEGKSKIYLSYDSCQTWQETQSEIYSTGEYNLRFLSIIEEDHLIAAGWDNDNYNMGVIFLSSNNGQTWNKIDIPEGQVKYYNYSQDSIIWVGTNKCLLISEDLGKTWRKTPLDDNIMGILKFSKNEYYVATDQGIFYSSNNGESWIERNKGLRSYVIYNIKKDNNIIYSSDSFGFYFSTNKGEQWVPSDEGFCASNIEGITFNEKIIYISGKGIYKSTDNGNSWECIGFQDYYFKEMIYDEGILLADIYGNYGGLLRSTDDGESWDHIVAGLREPYSGDYINITGFAKDKHGNLYLSAYPRYIISDGSSIGGIMKSTDHGKTWKETNFISGANYIAFNSEDHLFTGFYNDAIFRSTDYGETWELVHEQTKYFVDDLVSIAFNPNSQVGIATGDSWDHLRTTDNGRTWYDESGRMLGECLAVDSTGRFWAAHSTGTSTGFLAYTTEPDGEWSSWHRAGMDLPHNNFTQVAVSPEGFIFAGARYGGLYRSKLSYVAVEEEPIITPDLMLEQNIPNPFSYETEIRYTLADDCHVKLIIYDALGRETAILENAFREKGRHIIKFNTADLLSGIYLYRLSACGETVSRQMQVIK